MVVPKERAPRGIRIFDMKPEEPHINFTPAPLGIALAVAMMVPANVARADDGTPRSSELICNYAIVELPRQRRLDVFRNHDEGAIVISRIRGRSPVYICDETRRMYEIHFNRGCNRHRSTGIPIEIASTCDVGWVTKSAIRVISG